jgi:hypothetical protein
MTSPKNTYMIKMSLSTSTLDLLKINKRNNPNSVSKNKETSRFEYYPKKSASKDLSKGIKSKYVQALISSQCRNTTLMTKSNS